MGHTYSEHLHSGQHPTTSSSADFSAQAPRLHTEPPPLGLSGSQDRRLVFQVNIRHGGSLVWVLEQQVLTRNVNLKICSIMGS